jgi:hypothetical protein
MNASVPNLPVSYDDVAAAAKRLEGHARRTPAMTSRTVDERTGATVFFKCENLQRMGAFKFRGAFNALSQLSPEQKKRGVLAYSSGNHAQAIALSGRMLGINTVIVMPDDAPQVKLEATRGYGAEVIVYDKHKTTREELSAKLAGERGLALIPPFNHPHVVAGQGTAAKELIEDVGQLDYLLVCCGGGGLVGGEDRGEELVPEGRPSEGAGAGNESLLVARTNAEKSVALLELGARGEGLILAGGVAAGKLVTEVVDAGRRGRADAQRDARDGRDRIGKIFERRLVVELVGIGGLALIRREGVAASHLEVAVQHGAIDDLGCGLRDARETHVAVEPREVDEREHRVGVQGIEDIGRLAAELGRINEAALGVAFPERDIADCATGVSEVHLHEVIREGRDRGRGGLVGDRGKRRVRSRGDGRCSSARRG